MSLKFNSPKVIFLIGRPCSGKTSAISILIEYIQSLGIDKAKIISLNDYALLRKRFLSDRDYQNFEDGPNGGFRVKNFEVLDDTLREINHRVLSELGDKLFVFIEFSRNKYVSALKIFDRDLIEISTIVYIYTPLNACLQRNRERTFTATDEAGYIPINILKNYYRKEDIKDLEEAFADRLIQVDNHQNDPLLFKRALLEKVRYIVD